MLIARVSLSRTSLPHHTHARRRLRPQLLQPRAELTREDLTEALKPLQQQFTEFQEQLTAFQQQLTGTEQQFTAFQQQLTGTEQQLAGVEQQGDGVVQQQTGLLQLVLRIEAKVNDLVEFRERQRSRGRAR